MMFDDDAVNQAADDIGGFFYAIAFVVTLVLVAPLVLWWLVQ
jgi:hypothetical protein